MPPRRWTSGYPGKPAPLPQGARRDEPLARVTHHPLCKARHHPPPRPPAPKACSWARRHGSGCKQPGGCTRRRPADDIQCSIEGGGPHTPTPSPLPPHPQGLLLRAPPPQRPSAAAPRAPLQRSPTSRPPPPPQPEDHRSHKRTFMTLLIGEVDVHLGNAHARRHRPHRCGRTADGSAVRSRRAEGQRGHKGRHAGGCCGGGPDRGRGDRWGGKEEPNDKEEGRWKRTAGKGGGYGRGNAATGEGDATAGVGAGGDGGGTGCRESVGWSAGRVPGSVDWVAAAALGGWGRRCSHVSSDPARARGRSTSTKPH